MLELEIRLYVTRKASLTDLVQLSKCRFLVASMKLSACDPLNSKAFSVALSESTWCEMAAQLIVRCPVVASVPWAWVILRKNPRLL